MKKKDYNITIVGAGVSGLIAAQVLENNGYAPTIIEASKTVGGRVKSDIVDGFTLDHGFQVLLSSYPAAQKYLDYNALNLQELLPGATIFKNGAAKTIGDPLRQFNLLIPTLTANIGTFSDKIKILKLNNYLKKKSITAIFETDETTTLNYLKSFGFSDAIITDFFTPFFSGIFLENQLDTSSRMFEFVYKMFGNGLAVIPKNGMQAISNQLKNNLKNTKFIFNKKVTNVKSNSISLADNTEIPTNFTIIATDANPLISNLKNQELSWKSCDTLYFCTEKRVIKPALIGLIADKNALINNLFYHTSVPTNATNAKELLSVTVVKKHNLTKQELIKTVTKELNDHCKITELNFLKRYHIKKALPKIDHLKYELSNTETKLTSTVFLAGDQLLNSSLNAAMISGERAALGVIKTLEDGLIVDELTSEYS